MKLYFSVLILGLLLLSGRLALACSCEGINNFASNGPTITIPAYTLPKGKFAVSAGLRYTNRDEFSANQIKLLNSQKAHAHSLSSQMTNYISLGYGLTDSLNVVVIYPYNYRFDLLATEEDGRTYRDGSSIGFGDLTLLLKYAFLKRDSFQAALIGGIKMPTGQTNERGAGNMLLGADDQPGSGSWDPLMGLAVSKRIDNHGFDVNALYKLSTKGSQGVIVGDQLLFNAGYSYLINETSPKLLKKIFPQRLLGVDLGWNPSLEMNGVWQEKVEEQGMKDSNHGGLTIFLGAGLKTIINQSLISSLYVGLPVIDDLNGTQAGNSVTLFSSLTKVF